MPGSTVCVVVVKVSLLWKQMRAAGEMSAMSNVRLVWEGVGVSREEADRSDYEPARVDCNSSFERAAVFAEEQPHFEPKKQKLMPNKSAMKIT